MQVCLVFVASTTTSRWALLKQEKTSLCHCKPPVGRARVKRAYLSFFFGNHNPQYQIGDQTGCAAGEEQDEEQQPEPERADPEELPQAAAYTS